MVPSIYSRTLVARTCMGPCKLVRVKVSSIHSGLVSTRYPRPIYGTSVVIVCCCIFFFWLSPITKTGKWN